MFNLSESEKKVLFAWGIIGVIIVGLVVLFLYKEKETKEDLESEVIAPDSREVLDRNRYYTVKNAIIKFYSYVNIQDDDAVLKILDEEYVKENHIDKDTVSNFIGYSDTKKTYVPGVICLDKIKKGVYSYAVEGYEEGMLSGKKFDKVYYEAKLDGNTFLFSVKPITEDEYKEVCNG